jgi:thiamine biosynthesis lipoprotein
MGSQILIAMDTDEKTIADAGLEAANWFEEWEQCFSRFRLTSELSEVNQHSGQFCQVSSDFWDVLELAQNVEKMTGGLVTPRILNALEEAGYTTSFENMAENIDTYLSHTYAGSGSGEIEIDENTHVIRVPYGVRLDFGGIVKGWAAQQTMIRLRDAAPVLIDAGGDIAISGTMSNGVPWAVGVADPFHPDQSLGLMMLADCGIATSGRDYRRWMKANQWQHHIIDPRTEKPAETDVMTATVIAKDVIQAEAWAKSAVIFGSVSAKESLARIEPLAYLLVLEDGSKIETPEFSQYRWNEKWQTIQNSLLV